MKLFLLLAFTWASIICGAAAEVPRPLKVLVVTGGHGFEKEPFFRVFKENAEIDFTAATQGKTAEAYDRADLFSYDVVVLYDMIQKITEAQRTNFLALFDRGIGLVVMHHALASHQDWPEYQRIIGASYSSKEEKEGKAGYQHDVEIPITIVAPNHPITTGLTNFMIHDEIYWGFHMRPDVTPLLTTSHPKSGKPLAWHRTQGKSRVVYLQLGHDHWAYENPNYRQLVARCIRWAGRR